mgnify:CR=1 FL=1|tara:strand:+ start:283 stop:1584 length:1302 start_codon:yes stop_codon:yes gene_type:complete
MKQNKDNEISSSILENCFNCGEKILWWLIGDNKHPLECRCGFNPYEKIQEVLIETLNKNKNSQYIYDKHKINEQEKKKFGKNFINVFYVNNNKKSIPEKDRNFLFGLELNNKHKSGILFTSNQFYLIDTGTSGFVEDGWISEFHNKFLLDVYFDMEKGFFSSTNTLRIGDFRRHQRISDVGFLKIFFNELQNNLLLYFNHLKKSQEVIISNQQTRLKLSKSELINDLDKDGNGQVDVIEGEDFNLLIKKHQKQIIELGRNDNIKYIQKCVQLKNYLNTQRKNIQHLFDSIKHIPNQNLLEEYVKVLKNQIHSYEVLMINSLNMICVLIEGDLLTFYEIYEKLDDLNVFNSNYQNEMLNRLSNIEGKLDDIIISIEDMSISIVSGLNSLTQGIENSSNILSKNLDSIQSKISLNTFITGISTYQMYKINKNIKS